MKRTIIQLLIVVIYIGAAYLFGFVPERVERELNRVEPGAQVELGEEARELHERILVADLHADTLMWQRDFLQRGERGQADLPRLLEGGVALQVLTTVTRSPRGLNYEHNDADAADDITALAVAQLWPPRTWRSLLERALYQAQRLENYAHAAPEQLLLIRDDIDLHQLLERRAINEPVLGVLLGTEGSHALEGSIDNVDRLHAAGFRIMGLQHFFDNELGGSLHGTSAAGLSDFGRDAVARMRELGIIIDVAHSSPAVVEDVLALDDKPVIVSHTGIHSHCPGPRNIPDELMKRIAGRGGIVGIGFWAEAVCDASAAGIADAIIAAVKLLGVDAVALGSDFDGAVTTSFDASGMPMLTQALLQRGMSEQGIEKVMGGNVITFLQRNLPRRAQSGDAGSGGEQQ
jgi:membrane dipeptidase